MAKTRNCCFDCKKFNHRYVGKDKICYGKGDGAYYQCNHQSRCEIKPKSCKSCPEFEAKAERIKHAKDRTQTPFRTYRM